MHRFSIALVLVCLFCVSSYARVVVFQEPGFPTVDSEPVSVATLRAALGADTEFADSSALKQPDLWSGADLLVLPYGSAVPVDAWASIEHYLRGGGNLLVIGGQPLHVPVSGHAGSFSREQPQDTFARVLDFRNTYAVPVSSGANFSWRDGYEFLPKLSVRARRYFTVEGRLDGLGYMVSTEGTKEAAPVIVADHMGADDDEPASESHSRAAGSRIVALDLDPEPGYLASPNGIALMRSAAEYARRGAEQFWVEVQYSTLRPGELPQLTLHFNHPGAQEAGTSGEALVELSSEGRQIESTRVQLRGPRADAAVAFTKPLPPGFYAVRATYSENGKPVESYSNGFQVEPEDALETGPALGVNGNFLTLGGKPFLPVGTNHFTTENNGWDFSGPRNALVWEHDFADMESHRVTLVRTGVWMSNAKFVEPLTGEVNERFVRNLEAYLAGAQRHHIAVNFTCFAMVPRMGEQSRPNADGSEPTPPNPYLDPGMVRAEQDYVVSIVNRFKRVPWLSWDLINEPSFSNPRHIFHGNMPNGDPAEVEAWHTWLRERYGQIDRLAQAWSADPSQWTSFDAVPLPEQSDLTYERYGHPHEVRAFDYNLFAQEMFAGWVRKMVGAIRSAGSTQLINVGQDEGGVTDRLLNYFYAGSGVAFTTNHTYWQDEALLWDSVAAKTPGIPNITGETGYQPVWAPDGTWRYDEFNGLGLEERKWALGFAAGSSGAMEWDWDREVDFGMLRSDGSAKVWQGMMRELGQFAKQAAPYATGWTAPQVAIVLPQSLQLSVYNSQAVAAQQAAVRALFYYDHVSAYAVGEYQINKLGSPKLIILPSASGLSDAAWNALEAHVRDGAVLLISGPFAADEHLHATDRAAAVGLAYKTVPLEIRDQTFAWAGDPLHLSYGGLKTTVLSRAELADGKDWKERPLGRGRILFSALPLELNDGLDAVAAVYSYALKAAGVEPVYRTSNHDPGMLICATTLPVATLYVLASETNEQAVSFHDQRSGKEFAGRLEPGRAALLLVGKDGRLIANYGWREGPGF